MTYVVLLTNVRELRSPISLERTRREGGILPNTDYCFATEKLVQIALEGLDIRGGALSVAGPSRGKVRKPRANGTLQIVCMRYPERDLAVIKGLLTEEPWIKVGISLLDARRLAAACGLAWLAGAKSLEMIRLRLRDWEPDGQRFLHLPTTAKEDHALGHRMPRSRCVPVLPLLRGVVRRRLADMEEAPMDALLLARSDPWDQDERGFIQSSDLRIQKASNEKVESLFDLSSRFASYMEWEGGDPQLIGWLSGFVTRRERGVRRVDDYEPPVAALRAILTAKHPAA